MKVTMLWYGGTSYAVPGEDDAEHFSSLKRAKEVFEYRAGFAPEFPCVEEPEALIFVGETPGDCPDYRLTFGPRGGVRVERT